MQKIATPILSFCIPTLNNPGHIRKTIESLEKQDTSKVEIIVLDEGDNDESKDIILKSNLNIKYFKRPRSGLDNALIFLTQKSIGRYIWWFGDDFLLENSLRKLIKEIESSKGNFYWLNSQSYLNPSSRSLPDESSYQFKNLDEIFKFDIGMLGFISSTIIDAYHAKKSIEYASKHVGSAFVCLSMVLYVISRSSEKNFYLGDSFFITNYEKEPGEVRWYDQYQVFGINLLHIVKDYEHFFEKSSFKKAISKNLERVMKAVFVEKARGFSTGFASDKVSIKPLFINYWNYFVFWVYLIPFILPRKVSRLIYKIFR